MGIIFVHVSLQINRLGKTDLRDNSFEQKGVNLTQNKKKRRGHKSTLKTQKYYTRGSEEKAGKTQHLPSLKEDLRLSRKSLSMTTKSLQRATVGV